MSSPLFINQIMYYDNTLLKDQNTRMCEYNFEESTEDWKLSSRPLNKIRRKPLPQEPWVQETPKKTKPLPMIPQHYYSSQLANHGSFALDCFVSAANTGAFHKQNIDEQNSTGRVSSYFPQLNNDICLSPLPMDSPVGSDNGFDKEHLTLKSSGSFQMSTVRSTQQEDLGTDRNGVRQVTVKSVNGEHQVWINIESKETGESVAKKIHALATFRTQKVLAIFTSSGRKIPLNKTPVFRNWEEMDSFKNGETWTYTCGPLKKSTIDNFLSKFIQV